MPTRRAAVTAFLRADSSARTLHAALEQFNATKGVHSWLDLFWPSRYLGRRDASHRVPEAIEAFQAARNASRAPGTVAVVLRRLDALASPAGRRPPESIRAAAAGQR